MSPNEKDRTNPGRKAGMVGYGVLLSLGLYCLILGGGAIYLLAPLLLPATLVQNNNGPFFLLGIEALGFTFLGGLLVPVGLLGLTVVHWSIAIGLVLISFLAAFGPGFLFSSQAIPVSPITLFSGVMVLLCIILLARVKRVWSVLWRTLLVACAGAAAAMIILYWPSPPAIYVSLWLNPVIGGIIVTGYWFAGRITAPVQSG